jgi:SAM-dependent methyltransferase
MPRQNGTGPGVITRDGCAVEFYALLPPGREPQVVHASAGRPDATVLDLGTGAGRVANALSALGHPVTAVDESAEMLAHVRGAETVCARIESLDLGRRFDVVLLGSHLVNVPAQPTRAALLATCARHVAAGGQVLIEQHPPAWFAAVPESETEHDGIVFRLRDVSRPDPGLVSATVEYRAGDRVWTQSFTTMCLDEQRLRGDLAAAGLAFDRYLTDDRSWLRAVPGPR